VRAFRIAVVAGTAVAVFGLGLAAMFSTGGGTPQTTTEGTIEVGVANRSPYYVSTGTKITIPNVRGESVTQAAQAFFSLGFQIVNVSNLDQPGATPGKVLEQRPAAGSMVPLGNTSLYLTVAGSAPGTVRIVPHTKG
jgi:beta-lactam-binding protein with PASTA domain